MEERQDHHIVSNIKLEDEEISEPNAKDRTPERDRSESRRGSRAPKRKKFEWQDEPTLFLIEFIKAHPSIWDTTDVMYRNVRMNKNLFLELVNVLGNKYPDHGYTYEIVRRKWDSLKGYYSRKAHRSTPANNSSNTSMEKDPKANGNANTNEDDASDSVHWAYFERLSFLATSLSRINASEAGSDEENELDYVQSEPLNLEFSNGSATTVKERTSTTSSKRRKCTEAPSSAENGEQPIPLLTNQDKSELAALISATTAAAATTSSTTTPPNNQSLNSSNSAQAAAISPNPHQSSPKTDADEFGIGKYVGKVLQDLDADLTDELVSRVVRDCIEVRHKQRLRYAEQFQNSQ
ncbi:uncharacterized protein LOC134838455 [Culicoides brevitarsis]|uniref:uncharacterized protein LOC134838455 n=1 Tax=Culicoides brevitarsis TaxID=469753 RepID=UPI00307B5309